jgi:hypothetical protein
MSWAIALPHYGAFCDCLMIGLQRNLILLAIPICLHHGTVLAENRAYYVDFVFKYLEIQGEIYYLRL